MSVHMQTLEGRILFQLLSVAYMLAGFPGAQRIAGEEKTTKHAVDLRKDDDTSQGG